MEERGIKKVNISSEMKNAFLDYAMSVIVARALPDVRDGLKPVQRRIVFGMNELGAYSNSPYKKSARIVGDVMGKYHPHGDSSIYDALVRMAQPFSYRYMLVDGQGNFGSIDGDGAAAQRYTEARMSKLAHELIRDINKNTVNFNDNYSGEEQEPEVLPARYPNLLVNGTTGIAVGMATNIPPHNLDEVISAVLAVIDNENITISELMENYIYGPDFPTGGYILGKSGIRKAYETGNGLVIMRAKSDIIESASGKKTIIVTELPYQVNKARMIEKIAEHVREKRIDGITELRDESNHEGIRVVIELRRDVQPEVVLNQLYKLTALQSTFGVNMLALVKNQPRVLNLKEIIEYYIEHQIEVIKRRTQFDLDKAEERAHLLEGLIIALDNIDAVIDLIRSSRTTEIVQSRLMEEFKLSERQAKAIREMQLQRLAGLEREKIETEYKDLQTVITDLKDILAKDERVKAIIKDELIDVQSRYSDERRTEIIQGSFDLEDEDLIPKEDIVISLTTNGYIKRATTDTFRQQRRGGRGVKGMSTNDNDIVSQLVTTSTHDAILFFTNFGKVYRLKGYNIPEYGRAAKGIPVVNLLELDKDETVKSIIGISTDADKDHQYLFFATKQGIVKKVASSEFDSIRKSGKIALTLKEGDELVGVKLTSDEDEILIASSNGKLVRFVADNVRTMGRTAAGVRGINVDGGVVVGITTDKEGENILVVTERGYGKMSHIDEYRIVNRGGKGVKTLNTTEKNGQIVAVRAVTGDEDLLIITDDGIMIRLSLEQVKVAGRATQGVKLIRVEENQSVATVEVVEKAEVDEVDDLEENDN